MPSEVRGVTLPPDDQMLCYDYLFYVGASNVSPSVLFLIKETLMILGVRVRVRLFPSVAVRRAIHALGSQDGTNSR